QSLSASLAVKSIRPRAHIFPCSRISASFSARASICRVRSSFGFRTSRDRLGDAMAALSDIIGNGRRVEAHRPWPRIVVSSDLWQAAVRQFMDAGATLLGLWGEPGAVHLALTDEPPSEVAVVTLDCPTGKFPSVGALH